MSSIVPAHTFASLHPPGTALVPLSSYADLRMVADRPWQTETISGNIVSCLGDLPALMHRRAFPEAAAEFMQWSGLEPPQDLTLYDDEADAMALARRLASRPLRLASVYPLPRPLRDETSLLVSPATYERLNSKANLADFCPAEMVPDRFVLAPSDTPPATSPFGYPVVVKGAVDGANGAGLNTRICHTDADFTDAVAAFGPASGFSAVIVERYLPFHTSWCINYGIPDDDVIYLGAAEQLFGEPGQQSGSLIDPRNSPPQEAIDAGLEICRRARASGYLGLCGFDMCVSEGRIYFFDLNFRLASSTCPLLLFSGVGNDNVALTANFSFALPYTEGLQRARPFAQGGLFVPTRFYDGTTYPGGDAPKLLTGIVVGTTHEAAAQTLAAMQAALA